MINSATSSRLNSLLTIWPTTARPPPRMLIGTMIDVFLAEQAFFGR